MLNNFPTCGKSTLQTTVYLSYTRSSKMPILWILWSWREILFVIRILSLATFQMIWIHFKKHSELSSVVVDHLLWVWAVFQQCSKWKSSSKILQFLLYLILNLHIPIRSALLTMVLINKCSNHPFCRRSNKSKSSVNLTPRDSVWANQHIQHPPLATNQMKLANWSERLLSLS